MHGLMMNMPLTINALMRHAIRNHPNVEIVSVTMDNPQHRTTIGAAMKRAAQLANALAERGVGLGDRVGTLAWNDYRHYECYYGVSCMGAVLHTLNPRLHPEQLVYILNHAEDQWLLIDAAFVPLLGAIKGKVPHLKGAIVLCPADKLPEGDYGFELLSYEAIIADQPDTFDWPEFDENTASSLCYTSGTTGNPKGVLYSHRSTILHAMASAAKDAMCVGATDCVLPVVPMFHVNAWSIPYATAMVGAKLVFPGPKMGDGETLQTLMESEKVTLAAGVPTVWLGLLNYLKSSGKRIDSVQRMIVGGSACPPSLMQAFQNEYQAEIVHAWGMTEMSPIGTINQPIAGHDELDADAQWARRAKQGRTVFPVEMSIFNDAGDELPWDGKTYGALKVRGPWIIGDYYNRPDVTTLDENGWFDTGDVATIDPQGYMQITDRTKDVIKSGGEWISSIDLENAAMGHPAVAEAAVIGVAHPKWDERPLLIVVRKPDAELSAEDMLAFFEGKIAKWWTPDAVEFVDELPHGATGKVQKMTLREQFADYTLPDATA
ncbi:MAG: 3-(methylthio)propionyl-CoA ligase [Oceanococcaceae bacterium]